MKMKKMMFLMLVFSMGITASMNAQVLIGSSESASLHPGAVLDLSPLGPQNFGLLLPNVELQNLTTLQLGGSNAEADEAATGMLVYNKTAKASPLIPKGLFVWNGTDWKPVMIIKES
jgi:hypothetical protein